MSSLLFTPSSLFTPSHRHQSRLKEQAENARLSLGLSAIVMKSEKKPRKKHPKLDIDKLEKTAKELFESGMMLGRSWNDLAPATRNRYFTRARKLLEATKGKPFYSEKEIQVLVTPMRKHKDHVKKVTNKVNEEIIEIQKLLHKGALLSETLNASVVSDHFTVFISLLRHSMDHMSHVQSDLLNGPEHVLRLSALNNK